MCSLPSPFRSAVFALLILLVGSAFAAQHVKTDSLPIRKLDDDTLTFAPLDSESCRPVGDETATVLSFVSDLSGSASLTVDWGDSKTNTFSSNVDSDISNFYFHAYDEPGLYEIKAHAVVKKLSDNELSWESVESEMSATVQVRYVCGASTNRYGIAGSSVLSNWYGDMMADAIEFAPVDAEICLNVGKRGVSTISVASIWGGLMHLSINWGDGLDKQYSMNVDRGLPYSFDHFFESVGTYIIVASATVKRPSINRNNWETANEVLTATVNVRDDCAGGGFDVALTGAGDDGVVTGEWSFFDFAPIDTDLCRSAGEEATALTLMSIFSGQLTVDVSGDIIVAGVAMCRGCSGLCLLCCH